MPLLNKLPNVGDRAVVLLCRSRGRNANRGWMAVCGGGVENNVDLALAEVLCNSKSHGNIRREDRYYDGISFTFHDPEYQQPDRKFFLNTVYYAGDYMSIGTNCITSQNYTPETKEFLAGFLYPQPVVDGSYAKLVQDVRGDSNIPASASALIETVKEQAQSHGIRWMSLPEQQPHSELPQSIRDRLESDYEALLNSFRGVTAGGASATVSREYATGSWDQTVASSPPDVDDPGDDDEEEDE